MSENPVNSKSVDMSSRGNAVVNYDRIIHKNVRMLDNQGMVKVIAVSNDGDTIIAEYLVLFYYLPQGIAFYDLMSPLPPDPYMNIY